MFDWFWEFLYGIVKTILFCIDFILEVAGMLCGIQSVTVPVEKIVGGEVVVSYEEMDLLYYFLSSNSILSAFVMVALVGFILLFIFTVFSVIRSMGKMGEGKSAVKICLDSSKILLYFLMVPGAMLIACIFVSTVMQAVNSATTQGASSLGASMFTIFAEEALNVPDGMNGDDVLSLFRDGTYDYYNTGVVDDYFKLSKFNYFLGLFGGLAVLLLLLLSLLGFVERIISLVVLFVIAPLPMSAAALDDGERFKLWREQVINKFLIAYGALISLNIFSLLIGVIYNIQFFDTSFMNGLARLVFLIGGAAACRLGNVLIGNLVNRGAGSQHAQDAAMVGAPFAGALHAAANLGGRALRAIGTPLRFGAKQLTDTMGNAVTRNLRARSAVKDEAARNKFTSKVHSSTGNRFKNLRGNLSTGNSTVSAIKEIGDILKGNPSGAAGADGGGRSSPTTATPPGASGTFKEKNDAVNQAGANAIKEAGAKVQSKKEDKGGVKNEDNSEKNKG